MNQNCEKYRDFIEDLAAGEKLDERTAAQTESHIFDCAECRNEYELLRQEKEILTHYLFDFEPPANSWANFQARLDEDVEKISRNAVFPTVELPRRKKRIFVFGWSPAFAVAAGLLLFFGIGFVWLKMATVEKNVAEIKTEDSRQSPQLSGADEKTSRRDVEVKNIAEGDAPKNDEPLVKSQSLKSKAISRLDKKPLAAETVKHKKETASFAVQKKPARETTANDETKAAMRRKRNLETEIATQIEKIELLLRSFRNAQAADGASASYDVEYEKRQARKLLDANTALRRDAEIYGIADAEELLSRVDSYLLEIANLGNNPAPEKVLDIKSRVSTQNVIASLQVYSITATQ